MSSTGAWCASKFRENSIEQGGDATVPDNQPNTMTVGSTVALNSVYRPASFEVPRHRPRRPAPTPAGDAGTGAAAAAGRG
jgi:hypothetical protein